MSTFNERLAHLSDQVRALDGGTDLALALMRLSADVDGYLQQQTTGRHDQLGIVFQKWNDFMNSSVEESYAYGKRQLVIERRNMARVIASDPRWQGGYADVLALFEREARNET